MTLFEDLFKVYDPLVRDLFKVYDPLVSIQGQNEEQRPSPLSTRSVQKSILATLSSYKVKRKNNDPLVSVQGQFKNQSS